MMVVVVSRRQEEDAQRLGVYRILKSRQGIPACCARFSVTRRRCRKRAISMFFAATVSWQYSFNAAVASSLQRKTGLGVSNDTYRQKKLVPANLVEPDDAIPSERQRRWGGVAHIGCSKNEAVA